MELLLALFILTTSFSLCPFSQIADFGLARDESGAETMYVVTRCVHLFYFQGMN